MLVLVLTAGYNPNSKDPKSHTFPCFPSLPLICAPFDKRNETALGKAFGRLAVFVLGRFKIPVKETSFEIVPVSFVVEVGHVSEFLKGKARQKQKVHFSGLHFSSCILR